MTNIFEESVNRNFKKKRKKKRNFRDGRKWGVRWRNLRDESRSWEWMERGWSVTRDRVCRYLRETHGVSQNKQNVTAINKAFTLVVFTSSQALFSFFFHPAFFFSLSSSSSSFFSSNRRCSTCQRSPLIASFPVYTEPHVRNVPISKNVPPSIVAINENNYTRTRVSTYLWCGATIRGIPTTPFPPPHPSPPRSVFVRNNRTIATTRFKFAKITWKL